MASAATSIGRERRTSSPSASSRRSPSSGVVDPIALREHLEAKRFEQEPVVAARARVRDGPSLGSRRVVEPARHELDEPELRPRVREPGLVAELRESLDRRHDLGAGRRRRDAPGVDLGLHLGPRDARAPSQRAVVGTLRHPDRLVERRERGRFVARLLQLHA